MKKGFTLIEILVVMGLLGIILGFGLVMSMEAYRGTNFRSERNTLVALLERARSQSVSNYCEGTCSDGEKHGVAINPADHPGKYVLFQTSSDYSGRTAADKTVDSIFDASALVTISPAAVEVIFIQLTASSTGQTISLSDASSHASAITIGWGGQISWTN